MRNTGALQLPSFYCCLPLTGRLLQHVLLISAKGLEIIAFPCNNFFEQEPGTNADVLAFINSIGVKFAVMGKLECANGKKTHPLYQFLTNSIGGGILGRQLKWNYTKFLVDANGIPIKRSSPTDTPLSLEKDILALLDKELPQSD